MFAPDFVVSGLRGVLQSLWTHFLATSVRWRAWPISLSLLGCWWDCIHSKNSLLLWGSYEIISASISALVEKEKLGRWQKFPRLLCREKLRTFLQTVLETLRFRRGLSGSPMAQSSLVINNEGLSWQTSAWPTRNKLQPAGKCCCYFLWCHFEDQVSCGFPQITKRDKR